MANIAEETGWYSTIVELNILPVNVHYIIRMISWFFITLALAFTVPILGLIVYDFFLWIWRLCSTRTPVALQPDEKIRTAPNMSRTSKSQISGAELSQAKLSDKPASD
ncbi:hypothetical protein CONLIGDRAFT_685156 [Coniochaeta ligniaria NRRL 30616]|uniref:Uncharacterized protein n=1 Tax=Coniochaeta ligniaria NRRL 30616 TaxID=1408157 RepID=A0A1J7JCI5_9PEZI|nr:hypothetical protein CONLIGDRAFT_685156 [Coniochaeta ligniaria NRRL 30616]